MSKKPTQEDIEWAARHAMCAEAARLRREQLWANERQCPVCTDWDDLPANAGEGET